MPNQLNATQWRQLGEEADGRRGETLAFVWDAAQGRWILTKESNATGAPDAARVRTEHEPGGLRKTPEVDIVIGGRSYRVPRTGGYLPDAIFLSQSAVEKFVLPYYARSQTLEWLVEKKNELFKGKAVAAIHIPPSDSTSFEESTKALELTDEGLKFL